MAKEVLADLELRIQQSGGRVEVGELPTLEALTGLDDPQIDVQARQTGAADGTLIYHHRAALQMARSLGQNRTEAILPPDAQDMVRQCLAACPAASWPSNSKPPRAP